MSVLHTSVLVLNQNYEPLNVCNARRAVVLLQRGKAEIVENGERIIHTVLRAIAIPSVIEAWKCKSAGGEDITQEILTSVTPPES